MYMHTHSYAYPVCLSILQGKIKLFCMRWHLNTVYGLTFTQVHPNECISRNKLMEKWIEVGCTEQMFTDLIA